MDARTAKQKYDAHKWRAKHRGIEFRLTFEEWLSEWGHKIDQMGVGRDQYGMCRVMDRGAYEVGNVFIGTPRRNMYSRRLVNTEKSIESRRQLVRQMPPAEKPDTDWNDENPWLPNEMRGPRSSFDWDHKY